MPVISAANLSIGYKGSPIVSNINLRLSTGRIICLLGANGAGKTTLMKTLLGRIKPVSGEVTYTGTNINEMSAAIDHPSFFPYLSGRENVEVVSAFWGLDVDPEAALDGVGINRAAYGRKAKDYSTGMKERLELCLALVPHPRVPVPRRAAERSGPRWHSLLVRNASRLPGQGELRSHLHASAS